MSKKFHINKHGVPAPCHAKEGNCPMGGDSGNENHFDTEEEAQAAADKINAAEFQYLPGIKKSTKQPDEKIQSKINNKESLSGEDLSNTDLNGQDMSGMDLSNTNFDGADLQSTNMSNSNLEGANLDNTNINKATLGGANLRGQDFSGKDMSNTFLFTSNLENTNFDEANLDGADLSGSNIKGSSFVNTDLSNTTMNGVDISNVRGIGGPPKQSEDGGEIKVGDTVYSYEDERGEERFHSNYDYAEEAANEINEDGDFHEQYAQSVDGGHVEPTEIKVDEGVHAHLNKVDYQPNNLKTNDGQSLDKGDEVYSYRTSDGEQKFFSNKQESVSNFEKDRASGNVLNNPFNKPDEKKSVSTSDMQSQVQSYNDENKSYSVHREVNEKMEGFPINKQSVGTVMNRSLERGSYNVEYNEGGNSMNVSIAKVEDGKYVAKGRLHEQNSSNQNVSSGVKDTGYVTFTEDELKNSVDYSETSDDTKPSAIFSGVHKVIKDKTK